MSNKYTFIEFLSALESYNFDSIDNSWLEHYKKTFSSIISPNAVHYGDCTSISQSCELCYLELMLKSYKKYYFHEEEWREENGIEPLCIKNNISQNSNVVKTEKDKFKIIFLDRDGVLSRLPGEFIELECLNSLLKIVEATNAGIVISSSWREPTLEQTKKRFPESISKFIISQTEEFNIDNSYGISSFENMRGKEIKLWTDKYVTDSNMVTWVILDDDSGILDEQQNNFVKCNSMVGLTSELANKAIAILNK